MDSHLIIRYDPVGDILFLWKRPPHPRQIIDMVEGDVLMRVDEETEEIDGFDLLFFSKRMASGERLELPGVFDMAAWKDAVAVHRSAA